jgi:hypothetical protein
MHPIIDICSKFKNFLVLLIKKYIKKGEKIYATTSTSTDQLLQIFK